MLYEVITELLRIFEQAALAPATLLRRAGLRIDKDGYARNIAQLALHRVVDTLITIPNQRLLALAGKDTPVMDSFRLADEVLLNAVRGISGVGDSPRSVRGSVAGRCRLV